MRKIFMALLLIFIISCTVETKDLDEAYKVCECHKGLREIDLDLNTVIANCNDGTVIRIQKVIK